MSHVSRTDGPPGPAPGPRRPPGPRGPCGPPRWLCPAPCCCGRSLWCCASPWSWWAQYPSGSTRPSELNNYTKTRMRILNPVKKNWIRIPIRSSQNYFCNSTFLLSVTRCINHSRKCIKMFYFSLGIKKDEGYGKYGSATLQNITHFTQNGTYFNMYLYIFKSVKWVLFARKSFIHWNLATFANILLYLKILCMQTIFLLGSVIC